MHVLNCGKSLGLLRSSKICRSRLTLCTGSVQDSRDMLSHLQFTTEDTALPFTTSDVMNLSAYVRKIGNAAYARAGFSDVWRGELTRTGQAVGPPYLRFGVATDNDLQIAIKVLHIAAVGSDDESERPRKVLYSSFNVAPWLIDGTWPAAFQQGDTYLDGTKAQPHLALVGKRLYRRCTVPHQPLVQQRKHTPIR